MNKETEAQTSIVDQHGCAIFFVAAIFLAIERWYLFNVLPPMPAAGSGIFSSLHTFMFGDPPYSFFDILLGFEFPDEGLLYILQPRNLLIGLFQAVHFGLNLGVATLPFWAVRQFKGLSRGAKVAISVGCLAIAALVAVLAASTTFLINSPILRGSRSIAGPEESNAHYSSREHGVSFDYPAYLEIDDNSSRQRTTSGQVITIVSITAASVDPFLALFVQSVEDPLRDEMFPNLYPPDDTSMRLLLVGDLSNLDLKETPANNQAIRRASDNAVFRNISGYRAASYSADLDTNSFGTIYLRGAFLVTERRDVTLMAIGGTDEDLTGSVDKQYLDELWQEFISTLELSF